MEHDAFPMVLRSGSAAEEVVRLIRARRLLAAAVDHHRAIVGGVSRAWIVSEVERRTRWADVHPALRPRFQQPGAPPPASVNSNWLPKIEPMLNACILTGVMLFGARLFGRGTPDPDEGVGYREIDTDLIIAGMIHQTFGLRDSCTGYLPERHRVIDEDYLSEEFSEGVLMRVWALREKLAVFDMALAKGGEMPVFPPEYANAIAAVTAARLRLTARAAGDNIFSFLDEPKRAELRRRGIEPGAPDAEFPERPYLERDYLAAKAAVSLAGVDAVSLGEPIRDVLLRGIEHVLYHGTPPRELVGKYGMAVRNFHCSLPLWDHYSAIIRRTVAGASGAVVEISGPFALGTLHMTGLEVTRYLHNVRRKGGGTGAAHAFLVSARVERLFGQHVSVPVIAGSDCHDVVEDGGFASTGYDEDLDLFACRFGAPLAALVAEVTDSFTKEDGPLKAVATARHPSLVPMEKAYNLGQLAELRSRATDPEMPFTLQGIIMKLADFGITQEEGLHDPDLMTGPWRHSGARFTWDYTSKGRIVRPLHERLRIEILVSRTDPFYHARGGSLPAHLVERLRHVLGWSFAGCDLYQAQNLAILAREYGLSAEERGALLRFFFTEEGELAEPGPFFDALFDDGRLDPELRRRGFAATYRLVPGGEPTRDIGRLVSFWETAHWRRRVRRELELPPLAGERMEEVLEHWALSLDRAGGSASPG
jgi:hypothetical protein